MEGSVSWVRQMHIDHLWSDTPVIGQTASINNIVSELLVGLCQDRRWNHGDVYTFTDTVRFMSGQPNTVFARVHELGVPDDKISSFSLDKLLALSWVVELVGLWQRDIVFTDILLSF